MRVSDRERGGHDAPAHVHARQPLGHLAAHLRDAIAALGEVGTPEAVEAIKAFSADAPPEFAEAIGDALEVAAEFGADPSRGEMGEDDDEE